jgi:hypothetical protein
MNIRAAANSSGSNDEKPNTVLTGTVEKIIRSPDPEVPEKAQISIDQGEDLYREIRVENTLEDESGNKVGLKPGAPVEVTIAADAKDTVTKHD